MRLNIYGYTELQAVREMQVDLEYVSVGCTRTPFAADWGVGGILAYGVDGCVALAKSEEVRGTGAGGGIIS